MESLVSVSKLFNRLATYRIRCVPLLMLLSHCCVWDYVKWLTSTRRPDGIMYREDCITGILECFRISSHGVHSVPVCGVLSLRFVACGYDDAAGYPLVRSRLNVTCEGQRMHALGCM